jgi:hypothetical protein
MESEMSKRVKKTEPRKDKRVPLMVYMAPKLVVRLKKAALDKDLNVYEIVEQASELWLASIKQK